MWFLKLAVPAEWGFKPYSRDSLDEKSKYPLSPGSGGVVTSDW